MTPAVNSAYAAETLVATSVIVKIVKLTDKLLILFNNINMLNNNISSSLTY